MRYGQAVIESEIPACRWVQLACQRPLNDLARFKGKASPYRFNPRPTDKDGRSFHSAKNLFAFIERLRALCRDRMSHRRPRRSR